jgi:hypothetical protein
MVPGGVAFPVVDGLEAVQVPVDEGEGFPQGPGLLQEVGKGLLQGPAVQKPGEGVGAGDLLQ